MTRAAAGARRILVPATILALLVAPGCKRKEALDPRKVKPLGAACATARRAMNDLLIGLDSEKAGATLAGLAPNERLKDAAAVMAAAKGDAAALSSDEGREAAADIWWWLGIACPPALMPPPAPGSSSSTTTAVGRPAGSTVP